MAGVEKTANTFINTGGRVLGVTTTSKRTAEARKKSYEAIKGIKFKGMHYRTDIAKTQQEYER